MTPRQAAIVYDGLTPKDKNGKTIDLQDYEATEVVGVQIGTLGHKLWICIDGVAVLRIQSPKIDLTDMRQETSDDSA